MFLFYADITFGGGEYVEWSVRINFIKHAYEICGIDLVDGIQIVVHGNKHFCAYLLCECNCLYAVKVSDNVVLVAVVVSAVYG